MSAFYTLIQAHGPFKGDVGYKGYSINCYVPIHICYCISDALLAFSRLGTLIAGRQKCHKRRLRSLLSTWRYSGTSSPNRIFMCRSVNQFPPPSPYPRERFFSPPLLTHPSCPYFCPCFALCAFFSPLQLFPLYFLVFLLNFPLFSLLLFIFSPKNVVPNISLLGRGGGPVYIFTTLLISSLILVKEDNHKGAQMIQ
jgi:hypothetical protein